MFSHVMVGANDPAASKSFYDALFAVLGAKPGRSNEKGQTSWVHAGSVFMLGTPLDGGAASCGNGMTIGFTCESPEMVDAWHAAGVAAGGTAIEDPPGIRRNPTGSSALYLAYLRDPSGNKLCGLYRMPRE